MNFSAEKARRKWPCGGFGRGEAAMVTAAALLLMLAAPSGPRRRREGRGWSGAVERPVRASRPKPRRAALPHGGAVAEAASAGGAGEPRPSSPSGKAGAGREPTQSRRAGRARAAAALGLPAGADRGDRDRAEHSRHPRARRLRRRGSGAAGGGGAAGQAAGVGEARGDPALHDGVGDRRLDPHRHGAAGRKPRQRRSAISTISTRSNAAAATASPAPNCPNTAAPMRSTSARLKLANGQSISLTDRTVPRELRESVLHSVCARFHDGAGAGLGLVSRGPHPSRPDGAAQQLQDLPVERVGSAAADRAAVAGRAAGGGAAARGRRQIRRGQADTASPMPSEAGKAEHTPDAANRAQTPKPTREAGASRQQKSAGKTGAFESFESGRCAYCTIAPPPPCSAICELNGESPCCGSSTTTMVPTFTRL